MANQDCGSSSTAFRCAVPDCPRIETASGHDTCRTLEIELSTRSAHRCTLHAARCTRRNRLPRRHEQRNALTDSFPPSPRPTAILHFLDLNLIQKGGGLTPLHHVISPIGVTCFDQPTKPLPHNRTSLLCHCAATPHSRQILPVLFLTIGATCGPALLAAVADLHPRCLALPTNCDPTLSTFDIDSSTPFPMHTLTVRVGQGRGGNFQASHIAPPV